MAESDSFTLFSIICTTITSIGSIITSLLLARLIYIQITFRYFDEFYRSLTVALFMFNMVAISAAVPFVLHAINDTRLEQQNDQSMFILDHISGFFYVLSMASMDSVFLIRVALVFPETIMIGVNKRRINQLWIVIAVLTFTGCAAVLFDMFRRNLAAQIAASVYIFLLFGLSSRLLHIFVSRLRLCEKSSSNTELFKLTLKTTVLARISIYSTFVAMFGAVIFDMINMLMFEYNNDFINYLQRVLFVLDSVIGSCSLSLTLSENAYIYEKLFGCVGDKYVQNNDNISERKSGDVTATATII
eukprot:127494_1